MKSRFLMCFTIALFVALSIPVSLTAQEHPKARPHYKFVDLGTFGGPNSYFNGGTPDLNNRGIAGGTADTTTKDPDYPNYNPFLGKDPWILHGFLRNKGVLIDRGAFPGANSSQINGVNASGMAVGLSENGNIDPVTGWPAATAALWEDGRNPLDLGALQGGYESIAVFVDDRGRVVGISSNGISDSYSFFGYGTQARTFIWEKGRGMTDIGDLGGPDAAPGSKLNEHGQLAGFSYTNGTPNSYNGPACPPHVPTQDPFFWEKGKMTDIGTLGGTCGYANWMNDLGQVAGQSDLKGDAFYHPFFWEKGMKKLKDLGTLGGNVGLASWINDAGEVVGWAQLKNTVENHPFLWKKGKKMKDLGILKGDACDAAWGINSKTQVIGDSSASCFNNNQLRPFLWENGSLYDLSTAFPPHHFQWSEAVFINDSGEIAGNGVLQNGDTHAYLLIPCKAGTKGCKGLNAGATAHPATITQDRTAANQGSRSSREGMTAARDRLGHRYPYRGFGAYQEEK